MTDMPIAKVRDTLIEKERGINGIYPRIEYYTAKAPGHERVEIVAQMKWLHTQLITHLPHHKSENHVDNSMHHMIEQIEKNYPEVLK